VNITQTAYHDAAAQKTTSKQTKNSANASLSHAFTSHKIKQGQGIE
jgi:hypothetical protein